MTAQKSKTEALEAFENNNTRKTARLYFERVMFTRQGNFAFIASMLIVLSWKADAVLSGEAPVQSQSIFAGASQNVTRTLELVSGGLEVGVAILAGMVTLVLMDLYRSEFGTVIDE